MRERAFQENIRQITGLNTEAMDQAKKRQDSLAKPPGSLGRLEALSVQLAGITGKLHNDVEKQCIVIMSADNGVVAEGISSAPQSVTFAQTINFTRRLTGVGTLAKYFNVDLLVTDMGINGDLPTDLLVTETITEMDGEKRVTEQILNRKIRKGTWNLAEKEAMTRQEAIEALMIGIKIAQEIKEAGYGLVGIGEMGIGNTTTSSAILSGLTGLSVEETVGRGGGITDECLERKKALIKEALFRYTFNGQPDLDPIEVLAKVGGFDIAAMTGAFLGSAMCKMPVVIDGFISVVAALLAVRIAPQSKDYMIASHVSKEQGYGCGLQALGLVPMLNLDLRLGEGSGCPLAFQIIKGACAVLSHMATFEEAEINDEYLKEIRKLKF